MEIIFHNVNVILPNGEIFASGDKSRVGKIHEAGRKAALEKKRVNIFPEDANLFKGVAPGINQPIIVDGEVQLVLGVTGNPNEIVRYAELAFLTAELLINQAISNDNSNRRDILKDLEFASIVFDPDNNPVDEQTKKYLSSYLTLPKFIYLIVLEKKTEYQKAAYEIVSQIKKLPFDSDVIILSPNIFMILNGSLSDFEHQQEIIAKSSLANKIHIKAGQFQKISLNIHDFSLLASLVRSGIKFLNEVSIKQEDYFLTFNLDDVSYLLNVFLNKSLDFELFNSLKLLIYSSSQADKLADTIKTYIEENQEVSRTAERLQSQRNTVQKRFESIKSLCGLDPANFKDLMILYMLLCVDK